MRRCISGIAAATLMMNFASPSAAQQEAVPAQDTESSDDTEDEDGPATTATAALEKYGCSACHDLEGSEADAGPRLDGIASLTMFGNLICFNICEVVTHDSVVHSSY